MGGAVDVEWVKVVHPRPPPVVLLLAPGLGPVPVPVSVAVSDGQNLFQFLS